MVRNQSSFNWPHRSLSTFLNKYKSFIKAKDSSLKQMVMAIEINDQESEDFNELIQIYQNLIQEIDLEESDQFEQLERNFNLIIDQQFEDDFNQNQTVARKPNSSSNSSILEQHHQNLATFFRQNYQTSDFIPISDLNLSPSPDDSLNHSILQSMISFDSIQSKRNSISNILRKRLEGLQTDHNLDSDNDSEDTLETISSTQLDQQQPYQSQTQSQNQKRHSKSILQNLLSLDDHERGSLLLQTSWDSSDQFQLINDILLILNDPNHSKS